jgi:hypothetical protein
MDRWHRLTDNRALDLDRCIALRDPKQHALATCALPVEQAHALTGIESAYPHVVRLLFAERDNLPRGESVTHDEGR